MKMNMSKLLTIECILSDDKKEYYQKRREILDLISENDYYELMKKEGLLRDIEYAEKYNISAIERYVSKATCNTTAVVKFIINISE